MLGESGKPCPGKATQTLFIASLTEMNCTGFLGALSLPDDWGGAAAVQPWAGNTLVSIFFLLLKSQKKKMAKRWEKQRCNGLKQVLHAFAHTRPVGLPKLLAVKTDQQAGSGASVCLLFLLPAHGEIHVNGMLCGTLWVSGAPDLSVVPASPEDLHSLLQKQTVVPGSGIWT